MTHFQWSPSLLDRAPQKAHPFLICSGTGGTAVLLCLEHLATLPASCSTCPGRSSKRPNPTPPGPVHVPAMHPSRKVKTQRVCTHTDTSPLPSPCIEVSRAHPWTPMTLSIAFGGEFREVVVVSGSLCACCWLGMDLYPWGEELGCLGGREELKAWREEPEARGEPGTRLSLSAKWPRTETFAAEVRPYHGALSGAGGCFGPLNSPEAGPSETRASIIELFPPVCSVLPTVLRCHSLGLCMCPTSIWSSPPLFWGQHPQPGLHFSFTFLSC